ncbi:MAG: hypothetical protein ACI89X_004206, partial [Planctomycetota bacterium]
MHQVTVEYTVASTVSARVPQQPTLVFASANWQSLATTLPDLSVLSARNTGNIVVDHRSSWVRRIETTTLDAFIKTYEYTSWGDRFGNWAKWTAPWRHSRAARECLALTWLREHGFAAPEPLVCFEWRQRGFLSRATLLTASFGGEAADQILATADPKTRREIAAAIGALVVALHERGFRDRNLDLRNLLVHQHDGQITIAKIDSPRFRLVQPGRREDSLAIADWNR